MRPITYKLLVASRNKTKRLLSTETNAKKQNHLKLKLSITLAQLDLFKGAN